MKKKLLYLTLLLGCTQLAFAQLKILGKGVIGGLELPSDVFQVNGDMQLEEPSPFLRLKTSTGANSGFNWKNANDGNIGAFFLDPTSGNFYLDINGFSTNGAGAEFTFDGDGELGIGTNNPLASLDIRRSDGQALARFQSGEYYWNIYIDNGTGNIELFQNDVFKGRLLASGGTFTPTSDQRYKSNIQNIDNVLDRIRLLQPKTYTMKQDKAAREHIGFIAQEVEAVFPQMVYLGNIGNTEEKAYTMNYNSMAVIAIKGIQELTGQQDEVKAQQAEVKAEVAELQQENQVLQQNLKDMASQLQEMKALLAQVARDQEHCCQQSGDFSIDLRPEETSVTLGLRAELRQNTPNPFVKETRISYFIPEIQNQAFLRITDINGRLLQQIDIEETGEGAINLNTQDLSAGTYTYALFVDGQLVETRQMLIAKR